ncbi:peptide deformylase [Ancylobacter amanitiformis]|uniref:Peptide deformylase-like n=1 Tax=Ancylobacter amanitiformis TaxID=217069 RepID=A0ABU0LVA1_9HYPH|nr:peptide deformylase [Ancylobacter amanitiformis]MDQ0512550.1 peptide deformylase [Ancylobacter amanitiformis]
MTARPLILFPDPRLRQVAAPVTRFDAELSRLADDLVDTMRAAPGIGITAPHIGVALRLVALELPDTRVRLYANPVLIWHSLEMARHAEGSVSMPGFTEEVERPARVRVHYQDLDGQVQQEEADGLLAVCHQHEIDQLDGIFWIQRLSRLKRERLVKRHQKQSAAR